MNIADYIILGIIGILVLGYLIYKIVLFCKMPKEARQQELITYLMGLVAFAESEIGSGHGAEKLALVENYFKTNAPLIYKILLFTTGKDCLRDLIELALLQIKSSFSK